MPVLCAKLGLKWNGEGSLSIGVEPVVVIYETSDSKAHATFTQDIGDYLDETIVGVIQIAP